MKKWNDTSQWEAEELQKPAIKHSIFCFSTTCDFIPGKVNSVVTKTEASYDDKNVLGSQ